MPSLAPLLGSRLWQGTAPAERRAAGPAASPRRLGTGFEPLDRHLPEGGWPVGALTEVLSDREGVGELRLVMPALATLTRAGRWVVWIAPPHIPYAPALEASGVVLSRVLWIGCPGGPVHPACAGGAAGDRLWAAEQALRQSGCGAVLMWLGTCPREARMLRRLQIAAERGASWGVVFRPAGVAGRPSPAAVRLQLEPSAAGTSVRVLKCRGRAPLESVMML